MEDKSLALITFTTDFGLRDGYVGVMKGVISGIIPRVRFIDLTHEIPPQNILAAQIVLDDCIPYFPENTIHIVVVDPGVGTARRPIAARLGTQFFVGPDNGLITPLLERAEANRWPVEIVHLNRPEFWLPEVSTTFHGRDIFSPVAAHLAQGVPLLELGERINDAQRLSLPAPEVLESGWRGEVIDIDHFGNLGLNIKRFHLEGMESVQINVGGQTIHGLARTFGDGQPGELIALVDSAGRLSICVVNGSAARHLQLTVGAPVDIISP